MCKSFFCIYIQEWIFLDLSVSGSSTWWDNAKLFSVIVLQIQIPIYSEHEIQDPQILCIYLSTIYLPTYLPIIYLSIIYLSICHKILEMAFYFEMISIFLISSVVEQLLK